MRFPLNTATIKKRIMKKVDLKISKASSDVCMSNCPKDSEIQCGIMWRSM